MWFAQRPNPVNIFFGFVPDLVRNVLVPVFGPPVVPPVILLVGIDVAFVVVTVLVVNAIEKVGFEMLVTVEELAIPLPLMTGTDEKRVMVLLGVKTLDARYFICEKTQF
jgi:hypothetical protein